MNPASSFLSVQSNKCLVATCNLNQWALDFDGNLNRTIESIRIAKHQGAKYRLGPELEISGYSCEDHFLEIDTFMHCDQSLAVILESDLTVGILCDIGCPILHNNVRYNCRVLCLDRKIVHIRPKVYLADDGNYREKRFFTSWDHTDLKLHDHLLSDLLRQVTGQTVVPIGLGIIATEETTLASEICEELWTANSPHINLYLSGVEIITNGSGSHHELRKLSSRVTLMKNATHKCGGAYIYSNQQGCDGNRLYFDGSSLVCVNGDIVAQASQFSLNEVEVITAVVDLESIRSYRSVSASLQEQSSRARQWPTIDLRFFSLRPSKSVSATLAESTPLTVRIHRPEEECALGPACWLWDYLRRSGASGFLLPLSGGADSSATSAIVRVMCMLVAQAALAGNAQVIEDLQRLFAGNNVKSASIAALKAKAKPFELSKEQAEALTANAAAAAAGGAQVSSTGFTPRDIRAEINSETSGVTDSKLVQLAGEIGYQVMHTIYLGTSNSSANTQDRAKRLANSIHAYHNSLNIDAVVSALLGVFSTLTGKTPQYLSQGGTHAEDLALQNIQARLRMVMSYLCAQLFPWLRGNKGFLLVLGSANVDEALRGYMTKYDCSSADINPIGGMSKGDLKKMLLWVAEVYQLPVLKEVANAAPSAELRPIEGGQSNGEASQTDEEDMGMSYAELGVFGYLRKVMRCGPVKMFLRLTEIWKNLAPAEVAAKVKRFFYFYGVNRRKLTTLTPAYHAEGYSPDDNRFDLRQFLYNNKWTRQFNTIDSILLTNAANAASASSSTPALSKPTTPALEPVVVAPLTTEKQSTVPALEISSARPGSSSKSVSARGAPLGEEGTDLSHHSLGNDSEGSERVKNIENMSVEDTTDSNEVRATEEDAELLG